MIIVSQNKTVIVNFEHIAEIVVDEKDICLTDNVMRDNGAVLGTYETEERAKEVLQEIINAYERAPFAKVYEMPEE